MNAVKTNLTWTRLGTTQIAEGFQITRSGGKYKLYSDSGDIKILLMTSKKIQEVKDRADELTPPSSEAPATQIPEDFEPEAKLIEVTGPHGPEIVEESSSYHQEVLEAMHPLETSEVTSESPAFQTEAAPKQSRLEQLLEAEKTVGKKGPVPSNPGKPNGKKGTLKGFQVGSQPYKIHQAMKADSQTLEAIRLAAGVSTKRAEAHLQYWLKRDGRYQEVEKGSWVLAPEKV